MNVAKRIQSRCSSGSCSVSSRPLTDFNQSQRHGNCRKLTSGTPNARDSALARVEITRENLDDRRSNMRTQIHPCIKANERCVTANGIIKPM